MKIPLRYQISEYDCGPTSVLNGISFLFEREQIPPELIRNIMLYCLDCYGAGGAAGKNGTSRAAMMFLANWMNGFGKTGELSVSAAHIAGNSVSLGTDSLLDDALRCGGAAVVRLWFDEWHYVLLTKEEDGQIYFFDPYYHPESFPFAPDIKIIRDHPTAYNRICPAARFNKTEKNVYAFGPEQEREALLLFNEKTKLTAEKTIEYFI